MLFTREAFFLGSRDDVAIDDQRSGAIVVEGGQAQNCGHVLSDSFASSCGRLYALAGSELQLKLIGELKSLR